jgi:tetratricopeptide (TPR) repeat protein
MLPIIPLLAVLAALTIYKAIRSRSLVLRGAVVAIAIGALLSAIPVMRPWEYYNETVGGAESANSYFSDESIDLSLRSRELADYYHETLEPAGEIPYINYPIRGAERKSRKLDWVGKDRDRDAQKLDSEYLSGTVIMGARQMNNFPVFRDAVPVARFGNLFVFRGSFHVPAIKANALANRANNLIYAAKPDIEAAIKLLEQALVIQPKRYPRAVELGNQYLKLGNRLEALRAYRSAKENAPPDADISELLDGQIVRVETEPLDQIAPLRNPDIE